LILGLCLVLTENQLRYWRDSESLFTHALTVTISDLAHLCLGDVMQAQNRNQEAMNHYLIAWRLNPKSEQANSDIAYLLYNEGKFAQAATYYQQSLQQGGQNPELHRNYGIILAELGRFDEAMNQYTAAERLDATSAEPHVLMGYLLLQQGKDREALKQFRTTMQLDPNNYQLAIFTANLLAAITDPLARNGEEAKAIAEKIIKQVGDQQPVALDALAMANAETGDYDKAIQLQQEAVKLAEAKDSKADLEVMQKRLESYQRHQPWRESFKQTPTPQKLTPQ
jgi:tetratricopeptide (TPR) repeat protein